MSSIEKRLRKLEAQQMALHGEIDGLIIMEYDETNEEVEARIKAERPLQDWSKYRFVHIDKTDNHFGFIEIHTEHN